MSDVSNGRIGPKDARLFRDVCDIAQCWRQASEGRYVNSCIEEGWSNRRCCINCRVLLRLRKRLEAASA